MANYRRLFDEAVNPISTNRGLRNINYMVATHEHTKKGLSYFYPKSQVQDDGVHTKPLNLQELMQCNNFRTSESMY